MRALHKNTQQPEVLRQNGPAETQKLIAVVEGGNNSPVIDSLYRHADVKVQRRATKTVSVPIVNGNLMVTMVQ